MNSVKPGQVDETSKPKNKLKKWHVQWLVSVVAVAAFTTGLAVFGSREMMLAGLCSLGALTVIMAFGAFFRAYAVD